MRSLQVGQVENRLFLFSKLVYKPLLIVICDIEERGIKCTISKLITRRDENNEKVRLVNKTLEERKSKTNIGQMKYDNIVSDHLSYGGLHLNRRGDGALALNMINCIRT